MAEGKETCAAHTDKRGLWPRAQGGVLDSIYLCILTLLPWWQNTCMVTFFNDWVFFFTYIPLLRSESQTHTGVTKQTPFLWEGNVVRDGSRSCT